MRTPLVVTLLVVLALLALLGLVGCEKDGIPPLVEVTEVSPRAVEVGDRLEIRGSGFPQGRAARVTFRGTLRRPGQSEVRGATIETAGVVASSDRIEVVVGDAFEESFCGHGDHAAHTTASGEVEVAFASSTPGAPPLVGVMHGLTLDVTPSSVRASVVESRGAEGARVLAFLGVVAGPATPRGLPVEKVLPGSPAERAGFAVGDVLAAVDGVNVRELSDVAPASARSARLTLRHGESGTEETKTIAMVGYASERIPVEYGPALLVVGLALAVLLLLVLPAPALASELEMRIARRLRSTRTSTLALALVGRGPRAAASVLASVLVATFALGPHVIGADLDGAVLLVSGVALLVASRVARSRGVLASSRAAAEVALFGLVLAVAMAAMVIHGGAMHLAELTRAQGGMPWEFAAARHPVAFVLALAYLGALVAILRAREDAPLLSDARLDEHAPRSGGRPAPGSSILERLGLLVASALAVAVFFGGWQLPGSTDGHGALREAASAVVFVAKTWTLAGALLGVASLATPWSRREARAFAMKRLVPTLAVAGGLLALSRRVAPSETLELAAGAVVVTGAILLVLRAALRIRSAMVRPEPHASPFL